MSGSSSGNTTQTQKFQAPDFTIPGWKDYLSSVTSLAPGITANQYQGQTVAPESAQSQASGQMASSLAQNGTPLTSTAYGTLKGLADGSKSNAYIGNSPYLQSMIDSANKDITGAYGRGTAAQTDASAALSGAYGGSGWKEATHANEKALADSLGQTDAGLRQNAFNQSAQLTDTGLNRQLQASAMAPSMQTSDLEAINAQNSYGNQASAYLQHLLGAQQGLWNQQNQAPLTAQDMIANALQKASGSGGTSSSSLMSNSSPWQTAAGLAGLGAGAYSAFGP